MIKSRIVFTFGITSALLLLLLIIYLPTGDIGDLKIIDLLYYTLIAFFVGFGISIVLAFIPSLKKYTDLNLTSVYILITVVLLYFFGGDITIGEVDKMTIYTIITIMLFSLFALKYVYELIEKTFK